VGQRRTWRDAGEWPHRRAGRAQRAEVAALWTMSGERERQMKERLG
jgi:hypothetical protein